MPSQMDRELQAGLDYLKNSLVRAGIGLIEHRPLANSLTYILVGESGRTTDIALSNNFLCDLPATHEYQVALDSYASTIAGRLRCGNPNVFCCLSGIAIRADIHWPIQSALVDGAYSSWLLVSVFDQLSGKLAKCAVSLELFRYSPEQTTFHRIRQAVNRIRGAVDGDVITFFGSETPQERYQQIKPMSPQTLTLRSEGEVKDFLLRKTYLLGFQATDSIAQVWIGDPWDAEYLGVSANQLSKAAQVLRAQGLIDLAPGGTFARPSDKLIAMGGPVSPSLALLGPTEISLSSLPQKDKLIEGISKSLTRQAGSAVLVIDLDNFKSVNDVKGHSEGDACLEQIVKVIASVLGQRGTLYRWGGDEFAVLLPDFSGEEAHATADRIRRAIEQAKPGGEIPVTTSIGVCGSDQMDARSERELLDAADEAMYESKHRGKNRVTAWPIPGRQSNAEGPPR